MKINAIDRKLIKAMIEWNFNKGYDKPREKEISDYVDNMNMEHRQLVEEYIDSIWIKLIRASSPNMYFSTREQIE